MGNDIYSSASLTIAEGKATAAVLATAVEGLRAIPEIGDEVDTTGTPLEIIAFTVAEALGISSDEYSTEVVRTGDHFLVTTCGWGRSRAVEKALMILADAGFTGTVTCEDELYERWRHRIDAAGNLHRDEGTTVYSGGPITGVWIVQMQTTDESDPDHVAIVGSEHDAEAILADWARTEARTLITAGALDPSRIDFDVDDSTLLERWVDVGGVKWDVYQAQSQRRCGAGCSISAPHTRRAGNTVPAYPRHLDFSGRPPSTVRLKVHAGRGRALSSWNMAGPAFVVSFPIAIRG